MSNKTIVLTKDGSHTIFDSLYQSHYHSIYGAITESNHVFIQNGLLSYQPLKSTISILESGFGTGLNAFLSYLQLNNLKNLIIKYTAIEPNPLDLTLVYQLNYPDLLNLDNQQKEQFYDFHRSAWNQWINYSERYKLTKYLGDLDSFNQQDQYDLVYFDAFDPNVQSGLWSLETLSRVYDMMNLHGVFCTYSAKGTVKRNLKQIGFKVETLPGPPGKREMLRAIKV